MITMRRLIAMLFLAAFLVGACHAGNVQLVTSLTSEMSLDSGGKKDGKIILVNRGKTPGAVKVYQTDYMFRCDGSNDYGKPGTCPRSNCSWITFSPQQFTIPPGETVTIYYSVQVPKDDKLSGTYWSMLMVEPSADADTDAPEGEDGKIQVGLRAVIRYGVQIVTHIGSTGKREIKVLDKRLAKTDGKLLLQLDAENTGERWLRPTIWAEVYDDKGAHMGRFQCGRTRIFPGCSTRNCIDLSSLKTGKYQALVVIDNGDESVWGAQYALEIPE